MRLQSMRALFALFLLSAAMVGTGGCKEDKPAPSASGYYEGEMKPKSAPKGADPGASTPKNQAGNP